MKFLNMNRFLTRWSNNEVSSLILYPQVTTLLQHEKKYCTVPQVSQSITHPCKNKHFKSYYLFELFQLKSDTIKGYNLFF